MTRKPKATKAKRRPTSAIKALTASLGLSARRVQQLIASGMPTDPPAALAWRQERENSDTTAALRRERIKLVRIQREKIETELALSRKQVLTRTSVVEEHRKIGASIAALIKALETELPQLLLGLPLEKSRPLAKTRIREIQTLWADRDAQFWGENPSPDFSEPAAAERD
jgi:hypothetical protein